MAILHKRRLFWNRRVNIKRMLGPLTVQIFKYLFLLDLAFVFLFPFLYMIITSLKSPADLADSTVQWIPTEVYWKNFISAVVGLNYFEGLKNSAVITLLATIGHLISCSLVGYGLARYRVRGFGVVFALVVISIVIPVQVLIMPLYITFSRLKWLNTFLPLIVPSFLGFGLRGGLFVFLFRQFYSGIPHEVEEAARVDGCGAMKTFLRIILPISQPPMLVCTILSLVWHWNESYESSLYIVKPELATVTARLPMLYEVLSSTSMSQEVLARQLIYTEGVVMAATVLVLIPILVLYMLLQHWFMEGVERSGIVG